MSLQIAFGPILGPVKEIVLSVGPLLLNLLYALILLLIGLLAAKGLQWLVVTVLGALQLNKGAKQIGFTDFLIKGGLKRGPMELLGDLVYWLAIFFSVTMVAGLLGLVSAKSLLTNLLAYLPLVLSAAYVLGLGLFIAVFLSTVVLVIAGNIGLSNASGLAKLVQSAVVIFAFLMALFQLGVCADWIINSMNLIVGGVVLALALAFGLGAKELASDFLQRFFA